VATEADWEQWMEEFWEKEARRSFKWESIDIEENSVDDIDL
jgi:hypothetical protein